MLIPVILAGGTGSRLWPLSRHSQPKQFIPLFEGQSLFQKTVLRSSKLANSQKPIIVGNEQQRFVLAEQISQLGIDAHILLEPCGRNTAAAILLAARYANDICDNATLLVLPADHLVSEGEPWQSAVNMACSLADKDKLVTFGIKPRSPNTGYGYIQQGEKLAIGGYSVKAFKEKPELELAKKYLTSGEYYWNSGMFCFKANTICQSMCSLAPKIYSSLDAAFANKHIETDFIRPDSALYKEIPADSIDYAVMEKTSDSAVVSFNGDWNDIGAWDSLSSEYNKDDANNVALGDVILSKTKNSYVHSEHRLVATVGVDNLIVVETQDAVLVMNKDNAQDIKSVVQTLNKQNRQETQTPHRVSRPWGAFESIDNGERFQVKRITVNIGQRLSLQKHHHRSEHWVVVKGTARVTRDDEVFLLSENQSTYIPIGATHRLENVGKIPLEIIEVQSGAYLGEDDIVRLDDEYGRDKQEKIKEISA
jgi:mannose-1-phosphate guanylyltransferase/mannose-6-phosphate isomerase